MKDVLYQWLQTLGYMFLAISLLLGISLLFGFMSVSDIIQSSAELAALFIFVAGTLLICGGLVALVQWVTERLRKPYSPYMKKK